MFELYKEKFLGIATRYVKSRAVAKDVVQESFISIFNNLPTLENVNVFERWSRRIVVNQAIDSFNKQKKHFMLIEQFKNGIEDSAFNVGVQSVETVTSLDKQELLELISKMPKGYRMVFNLYIVDGYDHSEIAEILDIEEVTSRSQLHKAKKYLQKMINDLQLEKNG